jgi:hypothetical protein
MNCEIAFEIALIYKYTTISNKYTPGKSGFVVVVVVVVVDVLVVDVDVLVVDVLVVDVLVLVLVIDAVVEMDASNVLDVVEIIVTFSEVDKAAEVSLVTSRDVSISGSPDVPAIISCTESENLS